eukprot:5291028-Amphidinium_carterae.1
MAFGAHSRSELQGCQLYIYRHRCASSVCQGTLLVEDTLGGRAAHAHRSISTADTACLRDALNCKRLRPPVLVAST